MKSWGWSKRSGQRVSFLILLSYDVPFFGYFYPVFFSPLDFEWFPLPFSPIWTRLCRVCRSGQTFCLLHSSRDDACCRRYVIIPRCTCQALHCVFRTVFTVRNSPISFPPSMLRSHMRETKPSTRKKRFVLTRVSRRRNLPLPRDLISKVYDCH